MKTIKRCWGLKLKASSSQTAQEEILIILKHEIGEMSNVTMRLNKTLWQNFCNGFHVNRRQTRSQLWYSSSLMWRKVFNINFSQNFGWISVQDIVIVLTSTAHPNAFWHCPRLSKSETWDVRKPKEIFFLLRFLSLTDFDAFLTN